MAFDAAARRGGGGGGGSSRVGRGAGSGGGFDAVSAPSYQNGDSAYAALRESVEADLRRLSQLVAAARKQTEALGGKTDSVDLRKRMCVWLAQPAVWGEGAPDTRGGRCPHTHPPPPPPPPHPETPPLQKARTSSKRWAPC